ncbi:MAG: hypothetical protein ACRC46_04400 [Thermoguttaceae bacterium]
MQTAETCHAAVFEPSEWTLDSLRELVQDELRRIDSPAVLVAVHTLLQPRTVHQFTQDELQELRLRQQEMNAGEEVAHDDVMKGARQWLARDAS